MVSQLQKLPTDESLGTLEPVAHFDGAMPTGVTVSHQGRIFINFPKWIPLRHSKPVAPSGEIPTRKRSASKAVHALSRSYRRSASTVAVNRKTLD